MRGWKGPFHVWWFRSPWTITSAPTSTESACSPRSLPTIATLQFITELWCQESFLPVLKLWVSWSFNLLWNSFSFFPSLLRVFSSHWVVLSAWIFNLVKVFFFFHLTNPQFINNTSTICSNSFCRLCLRLFKNGLLLRRKKVVNTSLSACVLPHVQTFHGSLCQSEPAQTSPRNTQVLPWPGPTVFSSSVSQHPPNTPQKPATTAVPGRVPPYSFPPCAHPVSSIGSAWKDLEWFWFNVFLYDSLWVMFQFLTY